MCWDLFGATFLLHGQQPVLTRQLLPGGGIVCSSTSPVLQPAPTCINPVLCKSSALVGLDQGFQKLLVIKGKEAEGGRSSVRAGCLSSLVSLEGELRKGFEGD